MRTTSSGSGTNTPNKIEKLAVLEKVKEVKFGTIQEGLLKDNIHGAGQHKLHLLLSLGTELPRFDWPCLQKKGKSIEIILFTIEINQVNNGTSSY